MQVETLIQNTIIGSKSLIGLFEANVESHPNKIVIFHNDQSITYRDLNNQANAVAAYLIKLRISENNIVGILMERSINLIAAMLGVLKAGAAYTIIDTDYPTSRIEYILNDIKAGVLLTGEFYKTEEKYKGLQVFHEFQHAYISELLTYPNIFENPDLRSNGDTLACVIYTSGSTGKPKGVLLEHKSIFRFLNGLSTIQISNLDCIAQIANASFDAWIYEIWAALGNGGSLVIIDKNITLSISILENYFKKYSITTTLLTTGLFNQLVKINSSIFKSLKNVLFGGEAANPEIIRKILSNNNSKSPKLFNLYGPTECGVFITYYEVKNFADDATSVPIGLPVNDTQVYILDEDLNPVLQGEVGELYVAGEALARGYLNLPDLSAERFMLCPFDINSKMYKTGDLVRMLPDGVLDFVGRKDNQVKIRGHRIELEEIECALESHSEIWKAVVLAPYTQQGHRQLITYFVPQKIDNKVEIASIRSYCKTILPDYMIPGIIIQLDSLPLTSHGKVDRKKLSEFPINESATTTLESHNLNEIEKTLLKIWENVLRIKNIQPNDNFFDLGGDSIMIMQMISEAAENKIVLSHSLILQHPTIQSLASLVQNQDYTQQEDLIDQMPFDLSAIQSWYFDQSLKNPNYFHHLFHSPLKETIDVDYLKKAIDYLVEYHDVFQLRFFKENEKYRQYYTKEKQFSIVDEVDIKGLSQDEADKVINDYKDQLCNSIDIHNGPLIKAILFTDGKKPKNLMIVIHHLIIDGISWRVLINDLSRIYIGLLGQGSYNLPSKGSSFKTWVTKTREYALSKNCLQETKYWFDTVKSNFSLPIDYQKGPNIEASNRILRKTLSPEITQGILKTIPHVLHVDINDILLTALFQAIFKWSGQSEIILELEGHGREDITSGNFARTVGWFTGLFPVSLCNQSESLKVCLFEIQTQLKNIPVKGVGYGILKFFNDKVSRENLNPSTNIPIRFNYLGQFDQNSDNDHLFEFVEEPFSSPSDPDNERTHLLVIESWVTQGQFQVAWHYSDNYHCTETIEKLALDFNETLENLVKEAQIDDVNISLTPYNLKELNEILPNIKNVQAVYPLIPIQEGLLFHTIRDPKSRAYFIQTYWNCKGYDAKIMLAAWETLLMNHELFRANYLWEGLNYPIQVIYKKIEMLLVEEDWSTFTPEEQEIKLHEYLIQDRTIGIDLEKAPLMRLSAIRLSKDEHLILWSFHHIIIDAWSVCKVLKEVDYYYSALSSSNEIVSKESVLFGNYVGWYKRYNHSNNKSFWEKYLDDFTVPNQISIQKQIDLKSINQASYGQFDYDLSQQLSQSLNQFAKDNRLTLNTVLQGMWAYLLSIYCNTLDVVFGLIVSTRPSEIKNVNNIVGPLINTLPFRIIIDKNVSLLDYFRAVQNNLADIVDYSFYSHIEIQRGSQVTAGNNLFNSSFGFESQQVKELEKNLSNFYNIKVNEVTHYPLSLYIVPGECIQFKVSYDENLYNKKDVKNLINHYMNLLSNLIKNNIILLNQLSCLSPEEFRQITVDWNQTDLALPQNTLFIDVFEKQVSENPTATAIIYNNDTISYTELNNRANQLAHYLKKLNIKNNNLVGICLDRSPEMLIAILGVLKAGAAYVPLDPINPSERLNYIIEDSKASIVILSSKYNSLINFSNIKKIRIDLEWNFISENQTNNLNHAYNPENLTYVMYTSGSTGKPKGVMVHNLGFFNYLYSIAKIFGVQKKCNAPVLTSFAFDATVTSLFLPLLTGGIITLIPQNEIDTLYKLLLSKNYYHVISFTPAFLQVLGNLFESNLVTVKNVGIFAMIGEVLNEKVLELWRSIAPGTKFFNIYGPTETIVSSTFYDATASDSERTSVPIGWPINNTQIYILNEYMQPVPPGIIGELYIGGFGVTHGYLNKPELTSEKFIADKFSICANAKLFKTGDLARFQENGILEFLGRKDDQVKIRGYRIELQEIESILLQHSSIKEAIVCVYNGSYENSCLVAYIVSQDNQKLNIENIRNHLSNFLPQYMLPSYYIILDKLPLNINGKVDRKKLPKPKESLLSEACVAPRNAQEQKLANIWGKILQKSSVGINDNFFDQGGDSITAVQFIAQIRKEFGIEVSIRSIFDAPTIEQLSELLTKYSDIHSIVHSKVYFSGPSFIIPLQLKGNKKPLFLIHPMGGTVFCYLPLRNYIQDRPIYGIEDPGINTVAPSFNSFEELATYYIKGIKQLQPEGPYFIGGASLGGLISLEIVNQLNATSESVEFIGLFDSWALYPEKTNQKDWFEKHTQELHEQMNKQLVEVGLNPKDSWFNLQWQRKKLTLKYKLPSINNKVTLFKAETLLNDLDFHDSPTNLWDHYCRNLEVHLVPGDHYSMFNEQNFEKLGNCIRNCLVQCQHL